MLSRISSLNGIRPGVATFVSRQARALILGITMGCVAAIAFDSPARAQDAGKSGDEPNASQQDDESQKPEGRQDRGKRKRPGRPEGEGKPGEGKKRPEGGEARPMERFRRMFAELDKDQSGTIDKSEAPERLLDRWDTIDSDGDGQINHEEIRAMIMKMGERMRKGPPPGKPGEEMMPGPGGKERRPGDRMDRWGDKEPSGGSVEPVRPGGGGGEQRDGGKDQ